MLKILKDKFFIFMLCFFAVVLVMCLLPIWDKDTAMIPVGIGFWGGWLLFGIKVWLDVKKEEKEYRAKHIIEQYEKDKIEYFDSRLYKN